MCGIFGAVHRDTNYQFDPARVAAALDTIQHRGPDDSGQFLSPGVALGSQRLAIVDLSARGHMPMSTPDGRFWITYNGEIYNFRELRQSLEQQGKTFHSGTDTEVLLALYADRGRDMLPALNGMFAFAIWDAQERTLFAARDRMGVKPFYYTVHNHALYFASEQKALFAAGVPLEFDQSKWEELICFRFVAGEATPFRGVKRLLPGHILTARQGDVRTETWWDLGQRVSEKRRELPPDPARWFYDTLLDSVDRRRISDVPVGVLLSGGLDSSSIAAALAARAGTGVASFTVRFAEAAYDEGEMAKLVACRWGLEYHELTVAPDTILDQLGLASWLNDEPLAHGSDLHVLSIARHAKQFVTVLMSGEGADETMGGYVRYQPLRMGWALTPLHFILPIGASGLLGEGRFTKLSRFLALKSLEDFVLYNSCDIFPAELGVLGMRATADFPYRRALLDRSREVYGSDLMRRAMFVDQQSFLCSLLDRNDRMTMGASIECRVPFLDYRLVEILASLPSSDLLAGLHTKALLRETMSSALPRAVRQHRKWGFGVPWLQYLRTVPSLRDYMRALPTSAAFVDSPIDGRKLAGLIDGFLGGDDHYGALIRQLLMIGVWHEAYIQPHRPVREPVVPAVVSG